MTASNVTSLAEQRFSGGDSYIRNAVAGRSAGELYVATLPTPQTDDNSAAIVRVTTMNGQRLSGRHVVR